jgi:hypothetical protein
MENFQLPEDSLLNEHQDLYDELCRQKELQLVDNTDSYYNYMCAKHLDLVFKQVW